MTTTLYDYDYHSQYLNDPSYIYDYEYGYN